MVFQGLATGSLIYVVFFEILEKERGKDVNGFAQAMSMTLGYIFLVLLSVLEANSEQTEDSTNYFAYEVVSNLTITRTQIPS